MVVRDIAQLRTTACVQTRHGYDDQHTQAKICGENCAVLVVRQVLTVETHSILPECDTYTVRFTSSRQVASVGLLSLCKQHVRRTGRVSL